MPRRIESKVTMYQGFKCKSDRDHFLEFAMLIPGVNVAGVYVLAYVSWDGRAKTSKALLKLMSEYSDVWVYSTRCEKDIVVKPWEVKS